jgi:hypothetical protein
MTFLASTGRTPALARLGPHAFAYEACDIPPGMTIDEFRSQRFGNRDCTGPLALLRRLRSHQKTEAPTDAVEFAVGRSEKGHQELS